MSDSMSRFDDWLLQRIVGLAIMSDMDSNVKVPVYSRGEKIRKAREDMGWTQSDLAKRLKKSREAVAGWEKNKHKPSAFELDAIAELTGYGIDFFSVTRTDNDGYLTFDHAA